MFPVSDQYLQAIRAGVDWYTTCGAWFNGSLLAGATDLLVTGGSVTDSRVPGVRRQVDVDLVPVPGLRDLLAPVGVQLRPAVVVPRTGDLIPLGVFEVDSTAIGYGPDGALRVSGSDRWVRVQRAEFILPQPSVPGTVVDNITALIRGAFGVAEVVQDNTGDTTPLDAVVWDGKRDEAIKDLAESIGAWVYFDRNGVCTIDRLPIRNAAASSWLVDAGATGVLLDANRGQDRAKTHNVIVVTSEKVDAAAMFDPVVVWDDDPNSPTYAGVDPVNRPDTAGPFGVAPVKVSSALLSSSPQAQLYAIARLYTEVGLNSQLSLSNVPNHSLDALDQLDVILPRERSDLARPSERHVIDKVTLPLSPESAQSIETRATRVDSS